MNADRILITSSDTIRPDGARDMGTAFSVKLIISQRVLAKL